MRSNMLNQVELMELLKKVRMLCVDVDGTMTDGSMYLDENNIAIRKFYVHDGSGIQMIKNLGIKVAFVTTSTLSIINNRAEILKIDHIISGSHNKGKDILALCEKENINPKDVIHMGDDVNDISAFLEVGIPIAVANAVKGILPYIVYQTETEGGRGAVREICDLILLARTGKLYGPPYVREFIQ